MSASSMALKLVFFSIIINFCVGLIFTAIPELKVTSNTMYDSKQTDDLFELYSKNITIPSDDSSGLFNNIFDFSFLGFIKKMITMMDQYAFGFINYLLGFVGGWLGHELTLMLAIFFKSIIGILEVLGVISWIGKRELIK